MFVFEMAQVFDLQAMFECSRFYGDKSYPEKGLPILSETNNINGRTFTEACNFLKNEHYKDY